MKFKKIILSIIAIVIILGLIFAIVKSGEKKQKDTNKIQIVVSNFASYDFLRAIIGDNDNIELTFLMGPGKDSHSYDPTAGDLIKIQNADLFVYVGGEMEKWSGKVINSIDTNSTKIICISDYVDTIEEQNIDGVEGEEEHHHNDNTENENESEESKKHEHEEGSFDEHIWTSPKNAIKMVNSLEKAMEDLDKENAEIYAKNAQNYIEKIKIVDNQIKEIVDNKVRDRLVFADKMPMQYFINYYNLKVSAAFSGCSTETEPSANTIAYLEKIIKEEKIPVVLYIELNNGKVANTIAEDLGDEVESMQIQTLHNVSLDDFKNGETWVTLMTRNIDVLKKALK